MVDTHKGFPGKYLEIFSSKNSTFFSLYLYCSLCSTFRLLEKLQTSEISPKGKLWNTIHRRQNSSQEILRQLPFWLTSRDCVPVASHTCGGGCKNVYVNFPSLGEKQDNNFWIWILPYSSSDVCPRF